MVANGVDLGGTNIKAATVYKDKIFAHTGFVIPFASTQRNHVFEKIIYSIEALLALVDDKPIGNGIGLTRMISMYRKSGIIISFAHMNYIHIPDIIKAIVSGAAAKADNFILKPAKETASRLFMPPFIEDFEIIYKSLSNRAALLEVGSLAFEEL